MGADRGAQHDRLDDIRDVVSRERRTDDFSESSRRLVAADFDLIPLFPVLIDAKYPDMTDVVVAAGVHAARDVEIDLADVMQVVEVVELALDRFGHRYRFAF